MGVAVTIRFVGNMDEWMRDVIRRIEKLEARKKSGKGSVALGTRAAPVVMPPGRHTIVLPPGTTVVSASGDTVVLDVSP